MAPDGQSAAEKPRYAAPPPVGDVARGFGRYDMRGTPAPTPPPQTIPVAPAVGAVAAPSDEAAPEVAYLSTEPLDPATEADAFARRDGLRPLVALLRAAAPPPRVSTLFAESGAGLTSALRWLRGAVREKAAEAGPKRDETRIRTAWIDARASRALHDDRELAATLLLAAADVRALAFERVRRLVRDFGDVIGRGFARSLASRKLDAGSGIPLRDRVEQGWLESILDTTGVVERPAAEPLPAAFWRGVGDTIAELLGDGARLVLFCDIGDAVADDSEEICALAARLATLRGVPKLAIVVGVAGAPLAAALAPDLSIALAPPGASNGWLSNRLGQELARGALWSALAHDTQALFIELARQLAHDNPRQTIRLLNAALLAAATDVTTRAPAKNGFEARLLVFRSGLQRFFVQHLLRSRHRFATLLGLHSGREFLMEWSRAALAQPATLSVVDAAAAIAAADERPMSDSSDALARGVELTQVPLVWQRVLKLAHEHPRRDDLCTLLRDADLHTLLRLPLELPLDEPAEALGLARRAQAAVCEAAERSGAVFGREPACDAAIVQLDLAGLELTTVTGVARYVGLQKLSARNNPITELDPLARLRELRELDLRSTRVRDLAPIAGARRLRRLRIDDTAVADLSALSRLRGLRLLTAAGTTLRDITPLANLTKLRMLDLARTRVSDIRAIGLLPDLKRLNLSATPVRDTIALVGLSQLEELRLATTEIEFVAPLARLSALRTLDLFGTGVSDVSRLAVLQNLRQLDLGRTAVADLSTLAPLAMLQSLNLAGSRITDLAPLGELPRLEWLAVGDCPLADLSPLLRIRNLRELDVRGVPEEALAPLRNSTTLTRLVVSPGLRQSPIAAALSDAGVEVIEADDSPR